MYLNRRDLENTKRLGKSNARKVVDTLSYYKGVDGSDGTSNDRRVVVVVVEILKFGTSVSVFVFLLEMFFMSVLKVIEAYKESRAPVRRRRKRKKVTEVRTVMPSVAYENEFYLQRKREQLVQVNTFTYYR